MATTKFDEDVIKVLVNIYEKILNRPLLLFTSNGRLITTQNKFTQHSQYCAYVQNELGLKDICDKNHKKRIRDANQSKVVLCHAGLHNIIYPIFYRGNRVFIIVAGQVKLVPQIEECNQRFKKFRDVLKNKHKKTVTQRQILTDKYNMVDKMPGALFFEETLNDFYEISNRILKIIDEQDEKMQKRAEWMAKSAHALITPISSILSKSEVIYDCTNYSYKKKIAKEIANEVEKLLILQENMDGLLKGQMTEYPVKKFNIGNLIQEVVGLYKEEARSKGNIIRVNINQHYFITAFEQHIRRCLINVIDNAVKYSKPKTSIYVSIKYFTKSKNELEIVVENIGAPILRKEINYDYIFQEGYRGIYASRYNAIGSGIGLPETRKILERHHGNIIIESTFNRAKAAKIRVVIVIPINQKSSQLIDYNINSSQLDTYLIKRLVKMLSDNIKMRVLFTDNNNNHSSKSYPSFCLHIQKNPLANELCEKNILKSNNTLTYGNNTGKIVTCWAGVNLIRVQICPNNNVKLGTIYAGNFLLDEVEDQDRYKFNSAIQILKGTGVSDAEINELIKRFNELEHYPRQRINNFQGMIEQLSTYILNLATGKTVMGEYEILKIVNKIHEFRTPLTILKGAASIIISEKDPRILNEKSRRLFHEAIKLNFKSENIRGKFFSSSQLIRLNQKQRVDAIIKEVIDIYTDEIKNNHIQLKFEGAGETEYWMSTFHLKRAFANILDNAIQFYDHRITKRIIKISLNEMNKKETIVTIVNYGYMIDIDDIEKIFDYGYLGINRKKFVAIGAGYGLPEAKKIIKLHGGTMSLSQKKDVVGNLITFKIKLPRHRM